MRRSTIRVALLCWATVSILLFPGRGASAPPDSASRASAPADSIERWRPPRDSLLVTVVVIRHAEKNTTMLGHDVPLSDPGARRAQELVRVAGDVGFDAIYATPTRRTMQTGEPLAAMLGKTLTVVRETAETIRRLKTNHWGQTVLVIGHSDTVPDIVRGLTGHKVPDFRGEFDLIYVVTITRDGHSTITRLRYGASG
jgi:broad specificity phosphatase PhoE